MYSNLIQLMSSALFEKIKVSTGQLGLGNGIFSSICGTFFLGKPDAHFNLGHMSYLFNIWTSGPRKKLTTMQVIQKYFRLVDLKAHYQHQNLDPPGKLLTDLQLFRQEIQTCFELIEIILNSITAQFMADIASSIASKKQLSDPVYLPNNEILHEGLIK